MPHFVSSLLLILTIICFSFGCVFIAKFFWEYLRFVKTEKCNPMPKQNADPKIYYITSDKKKVQKPRKPKRKTPEIAFEGKVISPDQFKRIREDEKI